MTNKTMTVELTKHEAARDALVAALTPVEEVEECSIH